MNDNLIQLQPSTEETPSRRFWPRNRWKRRGLIGVTIFLAIYIGLHGGVRIWIHHRLQDNGFYRNGIMFVNGALREDIRQFWNTPIRFPAAWRSIPVCSTSIDPGTEAMQKQFMEINQVSWVSNDVFSQWLNDLRNPNLTIAEEKWQELKSLLEKNEPIFVLVSNWREQLRGEILNYSPDQLLPKFFDTWRIESILKLYRMQAFFYIHEKKFTEALQVHIANLPLYVQGEVGSFWNYYSAHQQLKTMISELQGVLPVLWDQVPLQNALNELNRWEPYLFRMKKEYESLYGIFTTLGEDQIPVNYEEDVKVRDYLLKLVEKRYPPMGCKQAFSKFYDNWLSGGKQEGYQVQRYELEIMRPFLLTHDIEEYYVLNTWVENTKWEYIQEQEEGKMYDQLRLAIAAKLYMLENKKSPTTGADLVPRYFTQEIRDRENGEAYQWNQQGQILSGKK